MKHEVYVITDSMIHDGMHMVRLRHVPSGVVVEVEEKLPRDKKKEDEVRHQTRMKAYNSLMQKVNQIL